MYIAFNFYVIIFRSPFIFDYETEHCAIFATESLRLALILKLYKKIILSPPGDVGEFPHCAVIVPIILPRIQQCMKRIIK